MAQGRQGSQEKFDIETGRLREVRRPISAHKPRRVDGPRTRALSNRADMQLAIFDAV